MTAPAIRGGALPYLSRGSEEGEENMSEPRITSYLCGIGLIIS